MDRYITNFKQKMKITFFLISNMYPNEEYPGFGSFVKNICDKLSKFNIYEKKKAVIKGKYKSKISKIYNYISFYIQIIKKYWCNYNFIYLHFPNHALPILYPLLKIKRKNLIVNLHGEDLMYRNKLIPNVLGKLMERICRKFANAIVVPSSYFKEIVINRNILPAERIIVSPSGGINEMFFTPKTITISELANLHIGYVGRLEHDKGIIEFLEVCKKLKTGGIDFNGTIIGYGSLYEYTKTYVSQSNLNNEIEIIKGVNQSRLGSYYRSIDVLIFSSSREAESLGLTGIEAMACGTPVIGSDIGGIKTYIKQGYNGWLTPVHDIDAIILALNKYRDFTLKERQEMSGNCVETAKKYYSENVAKELATSLKYFTV